MGTLMWSSVVDGIDGVFIDGGVLLIGVLG